MTDNGLAALAAALHGLLCGGLTHQLFSHDPFAAAILGERGVFLPDGLITRKVLRTWQEGAARDEATIATLRAALEYIRDELGVPDENYPAPVSNAADKARAALATAKDVTK
jgi:hypothetical protein